MTANKIVESPFSTVSSAPCNVSPLTFRTSILTLTCAWILNERDKKQKKIIREQIMSYPITDNTFNEFFTDEKPIITKYQPIS